MIKQNINYAGFDGKQYSEDFYFHLTPADLAEKEITAEGGEGLQAAMQRIVNAKDTKSLMKEFKDIILGSVGQKTPDGKGFMHTQEIVDNFRFSNAYSVLFMKLVTDAQFAQAFVNGIAGVSAEEADRAATPELDITPLQPTSRPAPQDRLPKKGTEVEVPSIGNSDYTVAEAVVEPIALDPQFGQREAVDYVGRQTETPEEWRARQQEQEALDALREKLRNPTPGISEEDFRANLRREAREQMGLDTGE